MDNKKNVKDSFYNLLPWEQLELLNELMIENSNLIDYNNQESDYEEDIWKEEEFLEKIGLRRIAQYLADSL